MENILIALRLQGYLQKHLRKSIDGALLSVIIDRGECMQLVNQLFGYHHLPLPEPAMSVIFSALNMKQQQKYVLDIIDGIRSYIENVVADNKRVAATILTVTICERVANLGS